MCESSFERQTDSEYFISPDTLYLAKATIEALSFVSKKIMCLSSTSFLNFDVVVGRKLRVSKPPSSTCSPQPRLVRV
jgi:hypothetical protein